MKFFGYALAAAIAAAAAATAVVISRTDPRPEAPLGSWGPAEHPRSG